jgi:gluconolactonase
MTIVMKKSLFLLWLAAGIPGAALCQESGIVAPGAKIELLADGFTFTEGPATDAGGNVFFTDQPGDRIVKWSTDGKITVFMSPCGRANGLCFDREGNLLAAADGENALWSIAPDGSRTVLARRFEGAEYNGPNDMWVHPASGDIYFTDPLYARDYWTHRDAAMQQDGQHVYRIDRPTGKVSRVAVDLKQPNGIIGTPDGKTLYIADIGAGKTYAYDIARNGKLKNKRLFAEMGSDGMTIDERGNIYLTGRGVTVFDPAGERIERIEVPERWTGNVTFAGPDRDLLFITASDAVYGLKMNVKGVY